MTQKGWITVRAPTVVSCWTTAWLISRTPASSTTPGPTMHHGPISTSSAMRAPASTTAVA
jgi:hypothetical protein